MVNHHLEKSLSGQSTHLLKELPVWRIRIDVAQAKSSFGAGLKQLLYLVSSVSHLSLWIISRNPTIIWIIWITYFRCGGLASHVRPQRGTWGVGHCCRRYRNASNLDLTHHKATQHMLIMSWSKATTLKKRKKCIGTFKWLIKTILAKDENCLFLCRSYLTLYFMDGPMTLVRILV